MGMFDTITGLSIACPKCKSEVTEAQTKEFDCILAEIPVGTNIGTDKFKWIHGIADCRSKSCIEETDLKHGYHSGFGYVFFVKIFIDEENKITSRYEILNESF